MASSWTRLLGFTLIAAGAAAQSVAIDPAARRGIDAANQAWVRGMKEANAAIIAATYASDALDCPATGDCIQGRAAIEAHLKERSGKLGQAISASVISSGAVQQGNCVYEWGRAAASFRSGAKVSGHYLTVWRQQGDGSWEIFRNMAIPSSAEDR
jgi:ketosteroid isomerase-like protein